MSSLFRIDIVFTESLYALRISSSCFQINVHTSTRRNKLITEELQAQLHHRRVDTMRRRASSSLSRQYAISV